MVINFYKLATPEGLVGGISSICNKVFEVGEKSLIFLEDAQVMNNIDEKLWTFSQSEFMPHMKESDVEFEEFKDEVPLLLTTKEQNDIYAENLIILKPNYKTDFIKNFTKVFFLFSGSVEEELKNAREFWKNLEGFKAKFYEQTEDMKWQLKAEKK